ncbi:MAG: hypothetical protein L0H94_00740 [Nitrospira sp.]|nr:hypothetical protein [Nitrospira sp.]
MKTTIYWTMQHSRQAVHEFRLRTTYWWLNQQVEFLEWWLRQESMMPSIHAIQVYADVGRSRKSACRASDVMDVRERSVL